MGIYEFRPALTYSHQWIAVKPILPRINIMEADSWSQSFRRIPNKRAQAQVRLSNNMKRNGVNPQLQCRFTHLQMDLLYKHHLHQP